MLLATSLLITSCSGENTTNTDNEEPATEIEEDIDNSTTTENENTQSTLGYTPDTYSSTQESFGGEMTLEVTFTKDAINSIDIIENSDTEGISTHVETVVLMSKVDK
ncbi:MAG: hypothetical protein ACK5LV_00050 [Lachnospirales bacterium]